MSKSVLISIRPEWVQKIFDGEKTLEVRRTRPRLDPPFTAYIYCTKARYPHQDFLIKNGEPDAERPFVGYYGGGMVVAEFTCDEFKRVDIPFPAYWDQVDQELLKSACLTYWQAHDYLGHRSGFGWHISNLKIYDEPKELREFRRHDPTYDFSVFNEICRTYSINRPPQSYCYVENIAT